MRHCIQPAGLALPFALWCALAFTGCAVDYELSPDGVDDGTGDDTPGTTGGGDDTPGANGGGGNNPWGNLKPDTLPEAYFIVAYVDYSGQANDPYYYGCYGEPVQYAMIDLRGHVIAEYDVPNPDAALTSSPIGYGGHHKFLPAGPGQFLAVTGSDYYMDADGWDCAEYGWGSEWYGWRGDGVTGDTEPVARGRWTVDGYSTHLIGADRDVVHGTYGYATTVAMQPDAPDDMLLWYGDETCSVDSTGFLHDLKSVNVRDATVPDVQWTPGEILPQWMISDGLVITPFTMAAGVDLDHDVGMVFGVTATSCLDGQAQNMLAAYTEADGVTWRAPVDDLPWPYDVEYSALDGGSALYLPQATADGQPYKIVGSGLPTTGTLPEELIYPRLGPLLDASGPSFMIVASNDEGTGDELVFMHGGENVWTIETLRFGLDRRTVQIRDVMLMPAVPE